MLETLLQSSYFALFLIIALGFILGRIQIKGLSLDVSAVIFIALLFGHFGVIIPKELGNFGLVLFIIHHRHTSGSGILRLLPFERENIDHTNASDCRICQPYRFDT